MKQGNVETEVRASKRPTPQGAPFALAKANKGESESGRAGFESLLRGFAGLQPGAAFGG